MVQVLEPHFPFFPPPPPLPRNLHPTYTTATPMNTNTAPIQPAEEFDIEEMLIKVTAQCLVSTSTSPVLTSILPFLLYRHSRLIQHTWSFVTHISISLFPQSLFEASSSNSFPQLLGTHQSVPLGRRGCTDVADKIKMFLVLPHWEIFTSAETDRVNISATTSDVGTLANHVPSIEPLVAWSC